MGKDVSEPDVAVDSHSKTALDDVQSSNVD
jgi:hypothetical protein